MFRYLSIFFFFALIPCALQAQGNLLKEADLFFQEGQFAQALNAYSIHNRNKPGDEDVLTKMGICYYETGSTNLARQSLSAVISTAKKPASKVYLYLAKSKHADGDFKEASSDYKAYLNQIKLDAPDRKYVREAIKKCGSGLRLSATKANAIVENIGRSINTANDDYGAVLSPTYNDRIYFSSVRPSNLGGMRNSLNQPDIKYGKYKSDVYSASLVNGTWDNINPLGNNLNSRKDDHVLDFASDGQALILWRSINGFGGDVIADTFSSDGIIRRGNFQGPIAGRLGDGGLSFVNDTTVLFYSNRPGGYGGMDLYAGFYSGGYWSKAYNLGPSVNSAYDDISPFISADGSAIYFASNRPESMGGYDIFKSDFEVGRKAWNKPVNLGQPINSGRDDYHMRIDNRGLQAYMTSNRPGGEGQLDIYVIYFKNYLNEQQSDNTIASLEMIRNTAESGVEQGVTGAIEFDESQIRKYTLKPVFYDDDDRVLTSDNLGSLQSVVQILRDNPGVEVEVIGSSDQSASMEFDLYFSIKRAEDVGTYLTQNGIENKRIICRGVGRNYPFVRHTVNGQPVIISKKLNRRVEFHFKNIEGLPLEITQENPSAKNPSLDLPGIQRLKDQSNGLSYRVKVALTSSMYNGDVISNYPDPMIDKPLTENLYRYTVGTYGTYQSAQFMKNDLIKRGITEVSVLAFLNGKELDKDSALIVVDDNPDLLNFLVNE